MFMSTTPAGSGVNELPASVKEQYTHAARHLTEGGGLRKLCEDVRAAVRLRLPEQALTMSLDRPSLRNLICSVRDGIESDSLFPKKYATPANWLCTENCSSDAQENQLRHIEYETLDVLDSLDFPNCVLSCSDDIFEELGREVNAALFERGGGRSLPAVSS